MSQQLGVWSYQRSNEPNRAEIRVCVTPGNRRPYDAMLILVDDRNVLTFPQRGSFDTPWGATQFVRERHGHLLAEGWAVVQTAGLASDVTFEDHATTLKLPELPTRVVDGAWTYRLPQDGSIAQVRVRVALDEASPYCVSSHEFDSNFAPCLAVERSMRYSRRSQAMDFLRTEGRALSRQGWELLSAVGLAHSIDLLDEYAACRLPAASLATQEAAWEFRDTLTGEEFRAELLVHCDRENPFEVIHFTRRPNTTRWYATQGAHHFEDQDSAMEAIRLPAQKLTQSGYVLVRAMGLGEGMHPADKHQDIQLRTQHTFSVAPAADEKQRSAS